MNGRFHSRALDALAALLMAAFGNVHAQDISFNIASTYSLLGSANAPTEPIALQVILSAPAQTATFVQLTSSDPTVANVTGGGLSVAAGQTTSAVLLSSLSLGTTTLTAWLGAAQASAQVSVVATIPAVPEASTASLLAAGVSVVLLMAKRRVAKPRDCA